MKIKVFETFFLGELFVMSAVLSPNTERQEKVLSAFDFYTKIQETGKRAL